MLLTALISLLTLKASLRYSLQIRSIYYFHGDIEVAHMAIADKDEIQAAILLSINHCKLHLFNHNFTGHSIVLSILKNFTGN